MRKKREQLWSIHYIIDHTSMLGAGIHGPILPYMTCMSECCTEGVTSLTQLMEVFSSISRVHSVCHLESSCAASLSDSIACMHD